MQAKQRKLSPNIQGPSCRLLPYWWLQQFCSYLLSTGKHPWVLISRQLFMKVQSLIGRKVNEALSPCPRSDVKVSWLPSLVTRWQLYFKSLLPQRRSRQKYPSSHNHAPVILLNAPLPRISPSELTVKVIKGRVRFLSVTSSMNSFDVVMTLGSANALLAVSERNKVNSLIGEWVILIGRLNCRLVSTVFVRTTTDTAQLHLKPVPLDSRGSRLYFNLVRWCRSGNVHVTKSS